jgi:acylphosphatase
MPPRPSPRPNTQKPRRPRPINVTRRYLIVGKVQGVFFRQATRLEALRLGIRGSARNLSDGSVEVMAQGAAAALEELAAWLRRGPKGARVDGIQTIEEAQIAQFAAEFEVL